MGDQIPNSKDLPTSKSKRKHLPEKAKDEGAKEMSGEERLPEERVERRVGVSESLRERR